MKPSPLGSGNVVAAVAGVAIALISGCTNMSESVLDESAGMNGSFEVVRSGLPVNWFVYTPKTIPTGDYDLVIDTTEHQGGRQSLKFAVRQCSPEGGWHSPGFSREYDATPGASVSVGFWVKHNGAEFLAKVGAVAADEIRYETVVRSSAPIDSWQHFEHVYTMPQGFNKVRFELNVLRPGTFWIDDVTISGLK